MGPDERDKHLVYIAYALIVAGYMLTIPMTGLLIRMLLN